MTAIYAPELVTPELVELTRSLGRPERDLVILAEGNTSQLLPDGRLAVKASGVHMAAATAEDFVIVDVAELRELITDPASTQDDLTAVLDAGEHGGRRRRGSIEALVHVAVQSVSPIAFVGHTHPTAVVGLLSSVHAETAFDRHVYSDEAVVVGRPLFVPYAQPGLDLARVFHRTLVRRVEETGELPALILLGNHGIVVTAPTAGGVEGISAMAVKGAQVRTAAYAVGGVAPLTVEAVAKYVARDDIAERRGNAAGGRY